MDIATIDYHSISAPYDFVKSFKNTGFAVIANHPIQRRLIEDVYGQWNEYFSSSYKDNYPYDPLKQDGYVSLQNSESAKGEVIRDNKEYYQLYFPWGRYPSEVNDSTRILFTQMFDLAQELLGWIEAVVPADVFEQLDRELSSVISMKDTMFRVINYPETNDPKDSVWAAAHEDINLITLLPASTRPGLEAQDANGDWHQVGSNFGQIIVNVGDMLQECSNGFFKSTTHRVTQPDSADGPRMSMPLFLHPNKKCVLSRKYTAGSYLQERLVELGMAKEQTAEPEPA